MRGLEQLLSSIFPGGHILSESTELPHSASAPSHAQGSHSSRESASTVSEEGVNLSNILRHIMPMLSENTRDEDNRTSTEGANTDDSQVKKKKGFVGITGFRLSLLVLLDYAASKSV